MENNAFVIITLVSTLAVGCGASFPNIGDGRPEDRRTIMAGGGLCFAVWFDNASAARATDAEAALGAICHVINDPKFREALPSRSVWTSGRPDDQELVLPERVLDDVLALRESPFHIISGPVRNANATSLLAMSELTKRPASSVGEARSRPAVNVDPERLDFWEGTPIQRACLVDTLAHELTHLMPINPESFQQKYQDHARKGRERMSSYLFGNAVGCFFLKHTIQCDEMIKCPTT